jgi:hypothetical protein
MLKAPLHWQKFLGENVSDRLDYVLALATLGSTTQIGSFLFLFFITQGGQGKYQGILKGEVSLYC